MANGPRCADGHRIRRSRRGRTVIHRRWRIHRRAWRRRAGGRRHCRGAGGRRALGALRLRERTRWDLDGCGGGRRSFGGAGHPLLERPHVEVEGEGQPHRFGLGICHPCHLAHARVGELACDECSFELRQAPQRPADAHSLARLARSKVEEARCGLKLIDVREELIIASIADTIGQVGKVAADEAPRAPFGDEQLSHLGDQGGRRQLGTIVARCSRGSRDLTIIRPLAMPDRRR